MQSNVSDKYTVFISCNAPYGVRLQAFAHAQRENIIFTLVAIFDRPPFTCIVSNVLINGSTDQVILGGCELVASSLRCGFSPEVSRAGESYRAGLQIPQQWRELILLMDKAGLAFRSSG